ncbi:glycoside hydrolase family 2 protein [Rathayibacter sp. VKM Ac-2856]|uniref:glycoside hydrolase family 2 TIM barrel-domain containing protein n=1 Tax=unclassified Rathayibacter TaxID=2609250 RepID=UPI001563AF7E|nr:MULTISPECIES: glycoside hydrolase family 2 TIM barrel-domain containing protein [unclassified Rathayibacter]NQX06854.1 glycoside hydrolase family 2 protein [Rathayibacter sp. VKM Ac-2858]NQX22021.1 glycoside hydrolase family 2 protein [Rathayibacter sp. VKM Ac-2856]
MTITSFTADWVVRAPRGPFAAVQGGADDSIAVTLPHDALRDAERSPEAVSRGGAAYYPSGAFSYVKTFEVPTEWAGRVVRLEVQGAYRHAMVFLNDEFAGNRADGFARFFVELTPFLRFGEANTLRIEVRSGQDSRWYAGAGLHRPVLLHVDEPVHIEPDGVRITTVRVEEDQAVVEVATSIVNRGLTTSTLTVSTEFADPSGEVVESATTPVTVAPGRTALVRQRLYVQDPALWSVDSPALHTARTSIGIGDDVVTVHGIRTVTVDPRKGLRINGEPVLLRGACIHSDNGVLGAASIARAEERRIRLLKDAGFNAIRMAHNPASPSMLDACDRLGMLVMDEAFDMWVRGKTHHDHSLDFAQWWRADLESMVAKDFNHPSVILYSIGNEIVEVGTPHGAVLARDLAEHVRALDPTRPVTNGVNPTLAVLDELDSILASEQGLNELMGEAGAGMMAAIGSSDAVTRRTAESSAALDVLGLNYADGRYASDAELFPQRVIVGSETFPSQIGELWPKVLANPNVVGDFTWTGWDYLGEVGIGATSYAEDPAANGALEREYPYLTAWCGDLDITGRRRPASYYREIVFGLRSEPAIAVVRPERHGQAVTMQSPWAWSDSVDSWTWPGFEGSPVTVEVAAEADEVALLLDGVEVGRAAVGVVRPMLASIETVYRPGELTAVAYRAGRETGRSSLVSASGPVVLTASADRTELRADDTDLAYVAIELRDAAGVLITGADRVVSVAVEGAGVLAGFGSGAPATTERFDAVARTTFDGRALAVVRPTGAGAITVLVSADGLDDVRLALSAV